MGNFFGKCHSQPGDLNLKVSPPTEKLLAKYSNVSRDNSNEITGSDSGWKTQTSFGSFSTQRSNSSFSSISRPWSRTSRRRWARWKEKTLLDPLSCSKTAWPVPCFESLFLPEFKIRDNITENTFQIIGTLSSGAFGNVFKVSKNGTNDIYAMKILSKAQIVANNAINQVKEEVKIQQLVGHHPFIVNCPFYWQSRKQLYIVSEYISGGELLELLQRKSPLPLDVVKLYTAQLAITLDFLHNAGIIYRDLKLENILLNCNGQVQLIDFGLAKWLKFGMRTNTICGTLKYIAPEILQKKSYGHAVDWWSLGIVVVCMIRGDYPYDCCVNDEDEIRPTPRVDGGKAVEDLVDRLLVPDPVRRLRSLAAIKRTAFFFEYDFDKSKRDRLRRRPFYIEDKAKESKALATTCNMHEDTYCRICFDDKKKEVPITPCKCKGTIGLVHMSCLEKWLSMSNTHSCELCGYHFQTLRSPKYHVLYSIYYWVFLDRNPQYHRGLKSDFIVFVVLTPIAFIGVYSCIIAADFYSKEPNKYSPASRWTTVSLLIMVVLLTFAYYLWVAVAIRFHMRIWYIWWQANNIVKVMPRNPNSNSADRITLSIRSSNSDRSNPRQLLEPSSSHADSFPESQPVGRGVTV